MGRGMVTRLGNWDPLFQKAFVFGNKQRFKLVLRKLYFTLLRGRSLQILEPSVKSCSPVHHPEFSLCFVTTQREQQRWMGEGSSCVRSA